MYLEFYGLRERPFELTANTRFLFLTNRQREGLSNLQYGLMSSKSLTLLLGEAGTGKTTLIRAALESERCRGVQCIYVNNPMLSSAEFVALLAQRFNLGHDAAASKPILLERLENELRTRRAAGTITALVVDEAQSLTTDLLEEIRLLTNIETPDEKLLPLVLAGQPELSDRLERFELRQLKQRVALRCELSSFELSDTAAYIATRIKAAGGVPAGMFTQEAVTLIHEYSRGIPRTINVICDNALLTGMALGHSRVERALVAEVCVDLRLSSGSDDPPPAGSEALTQMPAVNTTDAGEGSKDSAPGSAVAEDDTSLRSQFRFRLRAAQLDPERTVVE